MIEYRQCQSNLHGPKNMVLSNYFLRPSDVECIMCKIANQASEGSMAMIAAPVVFGKAKRESKCKKTETLNG